MLTVIKHLTFKEPTDNKKKTRILESIFLGKTKYSITLVRLRKMISNTMKKMLIFSLF